MIARIGLGTELRKERREKTTSMLLLSVPKVEVKVSYGCQSRLAHSVDFSNN
jgi:hypothetical protein